MNLRKARSPYTKHNVHTAKEKTDQIEGFNIKSRDRKQISSGQGLRKEGRGATAHGNSGFLGRGVGGGVGNVLVLHRSYGCTIL